MAHKIIIDADPGIGDALVIALALADRDIDVVGITATAGCVDGHLATRNVQAIVEYLDPPKWPRLGGSAERNPLRPESMSLNGPDGLGDAHISVAELHHPRESAKLMNDIVRAEPNEITLLTLGPLTNVEVACRMTPGFLGLLKELICFGGAVSCGGDVTAASEFNIYSNPEAARHVLLSPATKTLVPLDVTRDVVLTFEQFNRMIHGPETRLGRLLQELLPYSFRAYHEHYGLEGIPLHEVVALATIAVPRLFESGSMAVDVETTGVLTRGMTVFDRRGTEQWQTNIDVIQQVDQQGVLDYCQRIVRNALMG